MKKAVIVSMLAWLLIGCEEHCDHLSYWGVETCRSNLNKLEVGMKKDEVREVMMGEPYRREAQGQTEWWLYMTEHSYGWESESDYLTPLLFEDGKLVGWGKNFWTTKEQKFDVKIDQRIKHE